MNEKLEFSTYKRIVQDFIGPIVCEISEIENGLINSTFLVRTVDKKYILQKINTSIFKSPEILLRNYLKLNELLSNSSYSRQKITLLPSSLGDYIVKKQNNEHWRLMEYIEQSKTFLKVPNPAIAYNAAACFSEFYKSINRQTLALEEPIDDFINFDKRINSYLLSLTTATAQRKETAKTIIDEVAPCLELHKKWDEHIQNGMFAKHNIHADPKISNILFNDANDAIAVIDLDTVMNANLLYDFGDMARSYCNLLEEDDCTQANNFSNEIYIAVKKGFLSHLEDMLTPCELENLDYAAQLVVYIQAIRFLSDFLNGDVYYKTNYPTHNLDRAQNQFSLFSQMKNLL